MTMLMKTIQNSKCIATLYDTLSDLIEYKHANCNIVDKSGKSAVSIVCIIVLCNFYFGKLKLTILNEIAS